MRFATHAARAVHTPEMLETMRGWFAARTFDDAVAALGAHDVPDSPIMSIANIFADPHYRERGTIVDVPADGLGTLPQPAVVPRLSLTPGRVTHAGPRLGHHTDEILSGLLGLSAAEIDALRSDGVV